MSLLASIAIARTTAFAWPTRTLTRTFSSALSSSFTGYHQMLQSSDRQKVQKIAETFLPENQRKYFISSDPRVSTKELIELIDAVEATTKIPMEYLDIHQERDDAIHFLANRTFINLPYSEKVSKWSDRNALQSLIRDKFKSLFESGDLVLVPGCADGQIPIEIQAHALEYQVELDIIAADFNEIAMKLGYCTMKSYAIDSSRIQWVRADVTSSSFFNWVAPRLPTRSRHQIVTLIQPSLREQTLISFLKKSSDLAHKSHNPTTVVMPVLLEDHETKWYKDYEKEVARALALAKKTNDMPQLVWNKTKFGVEVLRLNATKDAYVPQQYFVHPEAIPEIQKITGYSEAAQKVFGTLPKSGTYCLPGDPRLIESEYSKRVFCVWDVK
ncbi:MAG: hypothetical protein H7A42_07150 [Chlamydiales bacterium]|nr:hypothetical protein [Chlamydiales bacterium]